MSIARILRRAGVVAATILLLVISTPLSLMSPAGVLADSWVITSLADDGSVGTLRYAIDNSNEGDVITFASGLGGTIALDSALGELVIEHPLTIEGPGAHRISIDGGHETRVLVIAVGDIVPIDDILDLLDSIGDFSNPESIAEMLQVEPSQTIEFEPAVVVSGLTLCNGVVSDEPESWEELFDAVGGNVLVVGSGAALRDCVIKSGSAIGGGGGIAAAASLLTLDRCTVRQNTAGGLSYDVGLSGGGGGLLTAIAYVDARDCVFEENVAQAGDSDMGIGGGMVSLVSFWDFDGCVIRANVAEDGDGPPGIGGGIVALLSLCRFEGCDVLDNVAGEGESGGIGGGVFGIFNLLFDMHECTISGNAAGPNSIDEVEGMGGGIGGGMFMGTSLLGGTVVRDSLISGNTAGSDEAYAALGGGIAVAEFMFGAGLSQLLPELGLPESEQPGEPDILQLHLVNCTLSGNSATATEFSMGGAVWAFNEYPVGLSFCTVTDNTASVGGGVSTVMFEEQGSEPRQMPFGFVLLKNSIVAGNTALLEEANDLAGPVVSLLGNVIGDPYGWEQFGEGAPAIALPVDGECSDIVGVNARLAPLADNGGPTLTHALLPDSPAVDAACDCCAMAEYEIPWDELIVVLSSSPEPGDGEECPQVETDQRNAMRPVDGDGDGEARCDVGAFEAAPDIELPGISGEVDAGSSRVGACTQVRVRVMNEGDAVLVIDHIEITGAAAGDFSLVGSPAGQTLLPGRSTVLLLRFCPSTTGKRTATLIIYSNDPLQDPLELLLIGTGWSRIEREDTPDPAKMGMSYLQVDPAQVLPGQQVVISANVCNSGEERGSLTATLMVNGSPEQSQSIGVSGGSCQQVVFTTAKAVPGTYEVSINGMQGQFSVLAPRTVQGTIASQQQTGLGTAGLVAIIAVAATLIAALVYVFRRE